MKYWIVKHITTSKEYAMQSAYYLNLVLRSLIISETDILFVAILNDQKKLINLHLFPVQGINSFKSQLDKIGILGIVDKAAYISIAYNTIPRSENLDKQFKKAIDKAIAGNCEDSVPIWTALHYIDGKYTELYQGIDEDSDIE